MSSEPSVMFDPWEVEVTVEPGTTVLEAGNQAGVDIEALCGGKGMCGTCAVEVQAGSEYLSSLSSEEQTVLDDDQIDGGHRLACRATVSGDVSVYVPESSRSRGGIVMTEGKEIEFDLDPSVRQYHLEIPAPTLEDTLADRDRVFEAIQTAYDREIETTDRLALNELPVAMRAESVADGTFSCTATVYESEELLTLTPGRSRDIYGLAIDIGTTTLAVYLMDLRSGEMAAVTSRLNPQHKHGGDIISRVQFARSEDDGADTLQREIVGAINDCIDELTTEADISTDDILEAVFVGNTAMHHLFLGIDTRAVAASPYVPATHGTATFKARELDVNINPSGYASWLPVIGGWVGPDFVADLLAAGILDRDENTVCIDIGTNGEIAAFNGEQAWVASAPAGPALEGAEIAHGMRAKPGAIEGVSIDPDTLEPSVDVIEDRPPIGICGSGILDVVAQLFLVGAINRRGRLQDPAEWTRIREDDDGHREYVLVYRDEAGADADITVSQEDIRDIQNAKAAIQTGTRILLKEAGIESVDRLVMAGGFGNFIDPASAKLIGMYPEIDVDQVEFLGNAAGYGAMYGLLNAEAKAEAQRIVDEVQYVELAAWEGFHDEFMTAMYLPHHDFDRYPSVKETIEAEREIDRQVK